MKTWIALLAAAAAAPAADAGRPLPLSPEEQVAVNLARMLVPPEHWREYDRVTAEAADLVAVLRDIRRERQSRTPAETPRPADPVLGDASPLAVAEDLPIGPRPTLPHRIQAPAEHADVPTAREQREAAREAVGEAAGLVAPRQDQVAAAKKPPHGKSSAAERLNRAHQEMEAARERLKKQEVALEKKLDAAAERTKAADKKAKLAEEKAKAAEERIGAAEKKMKDADARARAAEEKASGHAERSKAAEGQAKEAAAKAVADQDKADAELKQAKVRIMAIVAQQNDAKAKHAAEVEKLKKHVAELERRAAAAERQAHAKNAHAKSDHNDHSHGDHDHAKPQAKKPDAKQRHAAEMREREAVARKQAEMRRRESEERRRHMEEMRREMEHARAELPLLELETERAGLHGELEAQRTEALFARVKLVHEPQYAAVWAVERLCDLYGEDAAKELRSMLPSIRDEHVRRFVRVKLVELAGEDREAAAEPLRSLIMGEADRREEPRRGFGPPFRGRGDGFQRFPAPREPKKSPDSGKPGKAADVSRFEKDPAYIFQASGEEPVILKTVTDWEWVEWLEQDLGGRAVAPLGEEPRLLRDAEGRYTFGEAEPPESATSDE